MIMVIIPGIHHVTHKNEETDQSGSYLIAGLVENKRLNQKQTSSIEPSQTSHTTRWNPTDSTFLYQKSTVSFCWIRINHSRLFIVIYEVSCYCMFICVYIDEFMF